MTRTHTSYAVLATALLAGCSRSEKTNAADTLAAVTPAPYTAAASSTVSSTEASSAGGSVKTASVASIGRYLTDENGRALYIFRKDKKNVSTCADACAQAWPPFSTSAGSNDSSVKQAMIGSITRSDNRTQATYNGMPLYYYEDDKNPGDIKGQGKNEFGGLWYVVSPTGQRIEKRR